MRRFLTACAVLAIVGAVQAPAFADPVHIDFTTAGFAGPTPGAMSSFTKNNAANGLNLTFRALDSSLNPSGMLYWDCFDEEGHGDGFGVMGSGYSNDEIEADERLMVEFSKPINLTGFNLTDFFFEREPSDELCSAGKPHCYIEHGSFMVQFADNTSSDWFGFDALTSATRDGNGLIDFAVNFENVVGLVFGAPGELFNVFASNGYRELHDFSLAGIRFDETVPAPEPGTMMLLGLGLSGIAASRRRRRNNR